MRLSRMVSNTRLIIYGGLVAFAFVMWLQSRAVERFTDIGDINLSDLPDPNDLFKRLRVIIDRYDDPEMIQQITGNMDKDPGQLARKHLGIQNSEVSK
jgi:hypothetical protein